MALRQLGLDDVLLAGVVGEGRAGPQPDEAVHDAGEMQHGPGPFAVTLRNFVGRAFLVEVDVVDARPGLEGVAGDAVDAALHDFVHEGLERHGDALAAHTGFVFHVIEHLVLEHVDGVVVRRAHELPEKAGDRICHQARHALVAKQVTDGVRDDIHDVFDDQHPLGAAQPFGEDGKEGVDRDGRYPAQHVRDDLLALPPGGAEDGHLPHGQHVPPQGVQVHGGREGGHQARQRGINHILVVFQHGEAFPDGQLVLVAFGCLLAILQERRALVERHPFADDGSDDPLQHHEGEGDGIAPGVEPVVVPVKPIPGKPLDQGGNAAEGRAQDPSHMPPDLIFAPLVRGGADAGGELAVGNAVHGAQDIHYHAPGGEKGDALEGGQPKIQHIQERHDGVDDGGDAVNPPVGIVLPGVTVHPGADEGVVQAVPDISDDVADGDQVGVDLVSVAIKIVAAVPAARGNDEEAVDQEKRELPGRKLPEGQGLALEPDNGMGERQPHFAAQLAAGLEPPQEPVHQPCEPIGFPVIFLHGYRTLPLFN